MRSCELARVRRRENPYGGSRLSDAELVNSHAHADKIKSNPESSGRRDRGSGVDPQRLSL